MTSPLVIAAAVGIGLAVQLAWRPDPLGRLAEVRKVPLPSWIGPRPGALPSRTRVVAASACAIVLLVLLNGPLVVSLGLAGLCALLVFWGLGRLEPGTVTAARADLVADLPGALDLLSACVAGGMPLRSATSAVASAVGGPLGERLAGVVSRAAAGFGDGDAWAALREDEVLGAVARDLARAADAGTSVGPLLMRHAETARSAAQSAALARAKAVGVRTIVPVSVCYLPAFFLVGVVPVIAGVLTTLLR